MTETSQHVAHLDAEQLAAFAEGALPEHERQLVVRHMAECAHCREIAFLASESAPAKARVQEPAPWWRAWSNSWLLGGAGALAASALLLGVFLWKRPQPATIHTSTVVLSKKQEPPPLPPSPAAAAPRSLDFGETLAPRNAPAKAAATPLAAFPSQRTHIAQPAAQAAAALPAPDLSPQTRGATAMAASPVAVANAAPLPPTGTVQDKPAPALSPRPQLAPASPVPPGVLADQAGVTLGAARIQSPPVNGRNTNEPRAAKMRVAAAGPLRLQIEHGLGPSDGKAQLSGMVLDPSGATIPGATITLLGPSPGVSAKTVTDGSGHFELASVPAGQYKALITAPGFVTVAQALDLQSRDVARADTVLNVGAVSQAVEVSAASAEIATAASPLSLTELRGSERSHRVDALPGGHPAVTSVNTGKLVVALDAEGSLFACREGKHWKRVKPQWPDAVKTLELATPNTAAKDAKEAGGQVFQITTLAGIVWHSPDGEHWTRR